jgi:rhamnosyltransferase
MRGHLSSFPRDPTELCRRYPLVFLTQDAVPVGINGIEQLLSGFRDPTVGAAYGRQIARKQSGPIEYHARRFNYPDRSEVRDFASLKRLGIRAAFFSNSFAAYRGTAFKECDGFPRNTIVSEEISVVAQMLMTGWRVAYQSSAEVVHSHSFKMREEFSRYFDIGVHHYRERQIMDHFGRAEGEGLAFVKCRTQVSMECPAEMHSARFVTQSEQMGELPYWPQ